MKIIQGQYNQAIVYTDNIEEKAGAQIRELCDQPFVKESRIRIMPDTHAGAGCTIGTTMTIQDKIVPNLVGVDIGCGMFVSMIKRTSVDFVKLDRIIREQVPSGFEVRQTVHEYNHFVNLEDLKSKPYLDLNRARLSIGTLGGGNHFIEMNMDDDENLYLVVHSGSRYLGKQIAEYYQNKAASNIARCNNEQIITRLKSEGRQKEIQAELEKFKQQYNRDLAYLEGRMFHDYLNDMRIAQQFAEYNRKAIAGVITAAMDFEVIDSFTTIHNYIDLDEMILRKGAISAKIGETVIIPINMRDGSIIATGKGNAEWNQSAPHGAGRLMSRREAKRKLTLEDYRQSMDGIFSTSVSADTLDEAPFAYKPMEEIITNIRDTVEIQKIIRPIYNYKASGD